MILSKIKLLVLRKIHFQAASSDDKIGNFEVDRSEAKVTQCNNETETETKKEEQSAKSEQLDTSLENKIKGLAITEK